MKKQTSIKRKPAKAKIGAANGNVPVIKSFFAVLRRDGTSLEDMKVVIMGATKAEAITAFRIYNQNAVTWEQAKKRWKLVRVEAKNV